MDSPLFGFQTGDLEVIMKTLSGFAELEKAAVFGSRAKGNYKPGSDVDIAIYTANPALASKISYLLNEESLLPYKFDVVDYHTITHPDLTDHINRVGIVFYQK